VLGEPVVEIDSTGGVYRAYIYSPGGGLLALLANDYQFYWVSQDHLGSARRLTNTSGVVAYRAEFDPHGQIVYEWAIDGQTFKNSRKFTGYERDWETNLDNAKARILHFRRGRFMQPDPLGVGAASATNPQSLNRYSYVGNDPVNFVDPSGLLLSEVCATYDWTGWNSQGESVTGSTEVCAIIDVGEDASIGPLDPMPDPGRPGEPPSPQPPQGKKFDWYKFIPCALDAGFNLGLGLNPALGSIRDILSNYFGINVNPFQAITDSWTKGMSGPGDAIDSAKMMANFSALYAKTKYASAGGNFEFSILRDRILRNSYTTASTKEAGQIASDLVSLGRLAKYAKWVPIVAQGVAAVGFGKDIAKCLYQSGANISLPSFLQ
jgi:RHS repeat-associated protein